MHKIIKITKIIDENKNIKSFFFNEKIEFKPGQFIMLWTPGIDEKPFTVSYYSKSEFGITVEKKGNFTEYLHRMKFGDKIGFRGPYGNGFTLKKNAIIVGGGCGCAPLSPLIKSLEKPLIIFGARTKELILFNKRFEKENLNITTNDGSYGIKGFVTDILEKELRNNKKYKIVYTCGPELMMKKVFEICEENNIECQASLERYMRCGFGICGACVCGNQRVCKDGPIFNSQHLRQMKDFGNNAMLKNGKKVRLEEFYSFKS